MPMAAALAGSRYIPKPPATYRPLRAERVMSCCVSSTCIPAATAALASCRARTSAAVRYTRSVRWNTPLPSPSRVRQPRSFSGASSGGSSRPPSSIPPSRRSTATRSISPEPHRPVAAPPPMTFISNLPLYRTRLTAPSLPGMPQAMPAPSKAGPAATAQQTKPSRPPRAISPLVPMSRNRNCPALSASPEASSPAVMSPPT